MRSFKNKLITKREAGEEIEISIGSLYLLLRDYYSQNTYDFEGVDVLVAMPVAIADMYVWFCCMTISTEIPLRISGNEDKYLIVRQENGRNGDQHTMQVHPQELLTIMQKMPARGQYTLMIGDCEVIVYLMSMQCNLSDLTYMPIVPIDVKLSDLRQWPRDAINLWARNHLQLSTEQRTVMNSFDERWKMVTYAQEVFTYHCADFNPAAKKKMAEINKALKAEKIAEMVETVANDLGKGHPKHNDLDRGTKCFHANDDYIIEIGDVALLRDHGRGMRGNLALYYEDLSSKHIYHIRLIRRPYHNPNGLAPSVELMCYIDGKQHVISTGDSMIEEKDMCILYMDDEFLHISIDSCEDMDRCKDIELWHSPEGPVDMDLWRRCTLDESPGQNPLHGYDLKRNNPNSTRSVKTKNQAVMYNYDKLSKPKTEIPEELLVDPHESVERDPQPEKYTQSSRLYKKQIGDPYNPQLIDIKPGEHYVIHREAAHDVDTGIHAKKVKEAAGELKKLMDKQGVAGKERIMVEEGHYDEDE